MESKNLKFHKTVQHSHLSYSSEIHPTLLYCTVEGANFWPPHTFTLHPFLYEVGKILHPYPKLTFVVSFSPTVCAYTVIKYVLYQRCSKYSTVSRNSKKYQYTQYINN